MPADRIKKPKVFERNFECQVMDEKNAFRSESVLNQNTVKNRKLDGRVGAGFYAEYQNNSPKQAFFHLGIYSVMFQAEVSAVSEVAKNLLLGKMHNQSIVVLVDSQAAIKSLILCTVTSITVFNCIRNLNQLIIAMYSNHKIWCILGLGLSLLFIYIIYNFSKRTFSALPLALFRNI